MRSAGVRGRGCAHRCDLRIQACKLGIVAAVLVPCGEPPAHALERALAASRKRAGLAAQFADDARGCLLDLRRILRGEVNQVAHIRGAPFEPRRRSDRRFVRLSRPIDRGCVACRCVALLRVRCERQHVVVGRVRALQLARHQCIGFVEQACAREHRAGAVDHGLPLVDVGSFAIGALGLRAHLCYQRSRAARRPCCRAVRARPCRLWPIRGQPELSVGSFASRSSAALHAFTKSVRSADLGAVIRPTMSSPLKASWS